MVVQRGEVEQDNEEVEVVLVVDLEEDPRGKDDDEWLVCETYIIHNFFFVLMFNYGVYRRQMTLNKSIEKIKKEYLDDREKRKGTNIYIYTL